MEPEQLYIIIGQLYVDTARLQAGIESLNGVIKMKDTEINQLQQQLIAATNGQTGQAQVDVPAVGGVLPHKA